MFAASAKVINETSRADIRYWATLVSDIQMGGSRLEQGNYKLEISKNGTKVFEKDIKVENGKTTFVDFNN